jgi:predicted ATPase/DNA-binding SARP family transcriptional activator
MDVLAEGEPVPLGGKKQRAVLAELVLRPNTVVPRDRLVYALWGEDPPKSAVSTLQVYVHALRRALGPERIETSGEGYRLVAEPDEVDLERFERLVRDARAALERGRAGDALDGVERALGLWRGAAAGDHAEELEERRLHAVELRNDALLALGRHALVLPGLAALIAEHPYRERFRAQQIVALYRSGRQSEALEAYRAARAAWMDELGIEPTPELQELERAVLRHDPSLGAPSSAAPLATRLPVPPTALVGRGLEIAAVAALLRTEARLVTLVGPGGAGKTRLAIAVAEQLASELPDGALFVDLSATSDPELLLATVAEALGVAEGALRDHLADRAVLLVLDNLEQLLPHVVPVAELLATSARVRVLATSRAPLQLSGEHEYPVPPLPLPPAGATRLAELEHNEAVQLFSARARAVEPTFTLDDAAAATVAEICRRLDGLPLALELAAARVKLLPPRQLLARLERALELLASGPRDAPVRQQALSATIRWSYDLLDEREREAFARLAVFAGGCTVEAAELVAGVELETLGALVGNSLLQRRAERFVMLETVRAFALDRLEESGGEELRMRHLRWLADLAEKAEAQLAAGNDAAEWLERLESEHDNLRAALGWALDRGHVDAALALATSLKTFWDVRGHLEEGRRWLEQALDRAAAASPAVIAQAMGVAGGLAFHGGHFDDARTYYEQVLRLWEEVGDAEGVARAVSDLGTVAAAVDDFDRAVPLLEEAAGRFRDLGASKRLAITLGNLGHISGERGDFQSAAEFAGEALAIQRELGDRQNEVVSLYNIGSFFLDAGDLGQATARLRECLDLAVELGYREVLAYALSACVRICALEDESTRAAELTGAVDALLDVSGVRLLGSAETFFRAASDNARRALGDEAYDAAYRNGQRMPVQEAARGAYSSASTASP